MKPLGVGMEIRVISMEREDRLRIIQVVTGFYLVGLQKDGSVVIHSLTKIANFRTQVIVSKTRTIRIDY